MNNITGLFFDTIKDLKGYSKKLFLFALIIYFLTGIYTIKQNEVGVVTRFGKIISSNIKPGISYSLPWPIDNVKKIEIKKMHSLVIDDFVENPKAGTNAYNFIRSTDLKSYMITGDNNMLNIKLVIKYLIVNPVDYQNNFRSVRELITLVTNNTIIKYVSKESINNILIEKRSEMKMILKRELQKELNKLKIGIDITFLELKKVNPPAVILHFFNDVINANIDKNKSIEEAEGYKTNVLTKARIKAREYKSAASSAAREKINKANGEKERYDSLYLEYKKSPKKFYKTKYMEFISYIYEYLDVSLVTPKDGKKIRYTVID